MFSENFFKKVCQLSIASVFLLFVLGGLVRSTGSGMGCPDWPKCFGKVVPPINESELPANYKDQFLEKRLKKVEKFTKLLHSLGLHTLAEKVKNDPKLSYAHPYNKFTAYTEWVNRLFGVLTGFLALLCLGSAFQFKNKDKTRFWWVVSGVFWVIFNGWLGSVVVQTNLVPGIVTAHYAAAYFAFLSFIAALAPTRLFVLTSKKYFILKLTFILSLVEIFAGTSSREVIDALKSSENFVLSFNTVWLPGNTFNIHRFLGVVLLLLNLYLLNSVKHQEPKSHFYTLQKWVVGILVLQIFSGTLNTLFDIPSLVNVVHISFSAAIIGLQFWAIRNKE